MRELAKLAVAYRGRWCVYVVARYGREKECIVDHFYVDFGEWVPGNPWSDE